MTESLRPFEPYAGFTGRVRTTMAESEPAWPRRPSARGKPNVVVVLADDLGFSDLGCFGSEIPTPHLDAAAAAGVRCTNFRVTPLCSPTRAALMTGLNAHAAGIGFPTQIDPGFPGYASELPLDQPVLPEILRDAGYATLMVGKWHLCREEDFGEAGSRHNWPLQRGFDQFYGFLEALTDFHHPHRLYEGNSVVQTDEYPEGYYLTDDLTDRAVRMVREVRAADPDKPFLLYLAHGAVHAPMQARREDVERQRGRYEQGWDAVRAARLAKQVRDGVVPPGTALPPDNHEAGQGVGPWEDLSDDERTVFARYMEVYAAMVDSLDRSIGRLRGVLEEIGELDDTIFLFCSDNGAARLTDRGHALPDGATTSDTGTPTYFGYLQDDGGRSAVTPELVTRLDELGGPTTWPHYPRGWAQACNTPWRLYKFSTHRGGQQSPLIVSWPAGLGDQAGAVRAQYAHVTDVLPTLLDLLDLPHPGHRHGVPAAVPAGTSFAPALRDPAAPSRHGDQYTECVGNRAFYRDGWEAVTVRRPRTPFSEEPWELYDLERDPTQIRDLAAAEPERLAAMVEAFDAAAWANQVYPLDEGSGVKFLQKRPHPMPERLVLRPGTPTLERHWSSLFVRGSFDVVVDLDLRPGDEGVLVAHGSQAGGYLLVVEDGALHVEQNQFGTPWRMVPVPLADGVREVVLAVTLDADLRWSFEVRVDGVERARAEGLPRLTGFVPFEGIDVGIDRRSPVSWDLRRRRGTFPFSGRLHAVTYVPRGEHEEAVRSRLAQARLQGLGLQ